MFINDFTKRFTLENPRISIELLESLSSCTTKKKKNKELMKEVTEEEIHTTLSQINSYKALGSDGL